MKHQHVQGGFTLIELMIIVAIVGILSALAYPAFREQLIKSRRADAKTILVSAQQWMERFYTENFRYDKNSAGVRADDPTQFPARFSVSPTEGSALYDIAVVVEDGEPDKYSVTATRRAGSAMAKDRCGNFRIDHSGQKTVFSHVFGSANDAMANRVCWQ
ncbi:type IV pilin protein [Verminephrobacter eiseniae]|uniref:type IV pilin protein n=1 Tax=Verminephrobacter eiseniae TaxID=364317 RepID=UPI0010E4E7DA|nr:type IV pilin protein [Verminephrobacter eiseniae]KAB7598053.1 prepilin-type N-terminal cleavage/methylation domain-containing protein [Verminephrobacter sp. Larva24]MCW5233327.1 prepilin-type N-terminal cleavage/methylation domain-containing protein [Verminephrobacter eiseniae]MCW5295120.1 prepilin-type N-terminal cleavage/methylation domain-containing protein [Verminephrobacter eiseniae]MCW8187157.1 prepilin-type N-terminal cleavage/methylation domain-containing protein [Verminephrobacter 